MKQLREIKATQLKGNAFDQIGNKWFLITAKHQGKVNTMTASWGGYGVIWNKDVVYIFIRPQRYTKQYVEGADTFSLCFFEEEYREQLSYLGRVSGRECDKIGNARLTVTYEGETPYFEQANTVLICKKLYSQPLAQEGFCDKRLIEQNYPTLDLHTMYVGEVVKVLAE